MRKRKRKRKIKLKEKDDRKSQEIMSLHVLNFCVVRASCEMNLHIENVQVRTIELSFYTLVCFKPLTEVVTDRQTDRQTDGQTDRRTNRQKDRRRDRQTDRQT